MALLVIVPVLLAITLVVMLSSGEKIARIENLDAYLINANYDEKEYLQQRLYVFLDENYDTNIEKLIIQIREDTFTSGTTSEGIKYADFIIDIDELEASFAVSFIYPMSAATGVNPVFDCPAYDEMKYQDAKCIGMYNSAEEMKAEAENPIAKVLPISVDRYDVKKKRAIKYDIFGYYDEEKNTFSVRIIDYGGYAYNDALSTIREKGFDPKDYTIEYISYGGE